VRNKINYVNTGALSPLGKIDVGGNPIIQINAFSNLENSSLHDLSLHKLPLVTDWSPLQHIPSLISLSVHENNINDISFLMVMQDLATLRVHHNQIEDPSPLAGLNQLRFLDLSNNQISTFNFVSQLGQLNNVNLSSNEIEDIGPLINYVNQWVQDLHIKIDLSNNPLQDISQIEDLKIHSNIEVVFD
jgi:Leucine-rich repeat (LRR) protein